VYITLGKGVEIYLEIKLHEEKQIENLNTYKNVLEKQNVL